MSKRPRNGLQALQNADAQSTITLEIAAWVRNRSRKSASNLQHRKYQDLIRGSLDQRNPFLQRKWADDLNSLDLSIMYGKGPFCHFGRLPPIAQERFQGSTGRQSRLAIGRVLQEVVGWKVFHESLVQRALENLLSIDSCGPALATRLLVLARPDWFVVVNKKSFQGLAERFDVPGLQNLKPKLYAELLGKIHGEPWCRSQSPDDEQGRRLWNYRTALIDPLVYSETNDTFDE